MLLYALRLPGTEMLVHEQNPPTDLTIFVKRAKITKDKEHACNS